MKTFSTKEQCLIGSESFPFGMFPIHCKENFLLAKCNTVLMFSKLLSLILILLNLRSVLYLENQ